MTPTAEQLQQWRALAEAATPGPWEEVAESGEWWMTGPDIEKDFVFNTMSHNIMQADVDFIAAARAAVPALLAEVERLRAELAGYKRNAAYISSVIESEGVYRP